MGSIPEHIIEQIQDRVDIVEIVGGYIPLKKAGRNYKAPCPFHHEKTPSFMVSQEKQIFHCFGCGVGGGVFNFIMKYERLEFPEAVRMLAEKVGIAVPSSDSGPKGDSSFINKFYAANDLAAAFFQKNLKEDKTGRAALDYLLKRGLTEETIKTFRLGFSIAGWDGLLNFSKQKGVTPETLEKSGLAILKEAGGYFDRFRNRIMFTIFDLKSRVLGFGGRVFLKDEDSPKYMNSPETAVYNKGRNLYGLNFTWKCIRDLDKVIIVEGYLDLIVPFQYGIKNIVASLGTSLTEDHVRLLRRYTKNAVVIFDPDKAGELATLRSLDLLVEEGINVSVVRLPEGFDPDSFVKKFGVKEFEKNIKDAKNLFEYKMSILLQKYNKDISEDKARIVEEMLSSIIKIPNAVLQSEYIRSLAMGLGVDEDAIRQELKKIKPGHQAANRPASATEGAALGEGLKRFREAEKVLTGLLIDDNGYIKLVMEKLKLEEFQDPIIRKIIGVLFKQCEGAKAVTAGRLISYFEGAEAHKFIPELVDSIDAVVDKQKTLEDCILKIKQDSLKQKLNKLQVEIALAQSRDDEDRINGLILECNDLLKGIKEYEEKNQETQNQTFNY